MALEQGREVFAVPGSPLDPRAEGTNALLKQGAALVTDVDDILSVLQPILGIQPTAPAQEPDVDQQETAEPDPDERRRIAMLLGPTPVEIDDLVRMSGAKPAVVRAVLLELEIAGKLERQPGGRVSLV
jgi:DNA processing protein